MRLSTSLRSAALSLVRIVAIAEDNQEGEQVNEQKKTPLIAEESFEVKNTMRSRNYHLCPECMQRVIEEYTANN